MKKLGIVLGVAAVATITGCKDPDYKRGAGEPQNEVKTVTTTEVKTVEPAPVVVEEKVCTCAPGTKHAKPCACGAANCLCVVEVKPLPPPPPPPAPAVVAAEPEYTIYTVQSGDYLAKISKKYNVTIAAIKKANPSIKGDVVRVGQKLKLPGKFDVPAVAAEVKAPKAAKAAYAPYTGATKEYVVKSGDTLGAIAYGNGINIRQLKELNGLSKDTLRVGQKLKIPAEKVVKPAASASAKVAAKPAVKAEKKVEKKVEKVEKPIVEAPKVVEEKAAVEAPTVAPEAPAATAADETAKAGEGTYVVQEGDDMTGVSIAFGVTPAAIRELNNLGDNEQLKPGQVIKLPADAQQ